MKHVTRLKIENFQSHAMTEIPLSEGLNVFVGPSDSGKSAILRAMRWVLYNQPRGSDFIRAGTDRCRVTLTLSDGVEIIRERTPSANRYILRQADGSEQIFEGFGGNVPQEIMEAHGMHPLKLDADWQLPAQFGTQLEGPFLLSETGGVRAKSIGRVSGAHIIDIALRETVRDRQALSAEIKHLDEEAERLREALKPYENLPELLGRLDAASALHREAGVQMDVLDRLRRLKLQWENCRRLQHEQRRVLDRLSRLSDVEGLLARLERKSRRTERLKRLHFNRCRGREERDRCHRLLRDTRRCEELEQELRWIEERKHRKVQLRLLHTRLSQCRGGMEHFRRMAAATEGLDRAEGDWLVLNRMMTRFQQMTRLHPRWIRLQREKARTGQWMEQTRRIPEALACLNRLEEIAERKKGLARSSEKLKEIRRRIADGRRFLGRTEDEIRRYTERLADLFRRLGKCPTCGASIDGSVLKHIMEEYQGGLTGAAAGREDQGN